MWICAELLVTRSLTVEEILEGSLVKQKCTGALLSYCRAMHLASACQAAILKTMCGCRRKWRGKKRTMPARRQG